ncbi:acyltransferase family-domain-containing protein [Paraphysoderma sedebokerense]|nr:acyltransferase family-domain-containing protein [Paraphysoderma sedebokerense]
MWWVYYVNFFTWDNVQMLNQVGGMLWLTPWAVWASLFVYFIFAMFALLPSNRVLLYAGLLPLCWITYSYNFAALLGIIIADLSMSGHFDQVKTLTPWKRHSIAILALLVMFLLIFVRDLALPMDKVFASIQRFPTPQIKFSDCLSAFYLVLATEMSYPLQKVFSNIVFRYLGRLSLGITLLHLSFVYTIFPAIASSSESPNVAGAYFAILAVTIITSAIFHFVVEIPSLAIGHWFWTFLVSRRGLNDDLNSLPSDMLETYRHYTACFFERPTFQHRDHNEWEEDSRTEMTEITQESLLAQKFKNDIATKSAADLKEKNKLSGEKEPPHERVATLDQITVDDPSKATFGESNDTLPPLPPLEQSNQTRRQDQKQTETDQSKKPLDSNPPPTSVSARPTTGRLEFLDGIRGIAMTVVFNNHYFYSILDSKDPLTMTYGRFLHMFRNGQFALAVFFIISGRVITLSFLRKCRSVIEKACKQLPSPSSDSTSSAEPSRTLPESANKSLNPHYFALSASLFRRLFRLGVPVVVTAILQYEICVNGYTDIAIKADKEVLKGSGLGRPEWCFINDDVGGWMGFVIDVFADRRHSYILGRGSTLWSIYVQFWGSIYIYILSMIIVYISSSVRRYFFFFCIFMWTMYTYNFNLLFAAGLLLCDLHAASFLTKLKNLKLSDKLPLQIFLIGISLLFLGSNIVSDPVDFWAVKWMIRDGVTNHPMDWPVAMYPSRWIPAVLIMLWIEISPFAQRFLMFRFFKFVGKVSFGFYLLQFTFIYAVLPHLVIYLNAQSFSFSAIVGLSWFILMLLMIPASYLFYIIVEENSTKFSRWLWNFLYVSEPNEIDQLPKKSGKAMVHGVKNLPARLVGWGKCKIEGVQTSSRNFVTTVKKLGRK